MHEHPSNHEEEPQEPHGEIDPELYAIMASNGYYVSYLAINYFVDVFKEYSAKKRKAKGLPEQRRSPLQFVKDERVVWRAKKDLKKL